MHITGIDHVQVSVPVGSEDAVRRFYCDVLGLTEVPKPEALAGRGGLWLTTGSAMVHFGTEDVADRAASKRHVAFLVEDLAAARRTLEAAGREIVVGIQIPGYVRFECRDPFGNRLEFLERVTPRGTSAPS
jgi:catechol 2,3-dioxygenase-like lactoylglutathione lyase family enzyme